MFSHRINSSFVRLNIVYITWQLSWMLAGSLFEVYFFGLGMSIQDIYLSEAFWFMAALVMIPLFRRFRARNFMLAGIVVSFAAVSVLYFFPLPSAAFVYRLMMGMTHLLFWAPFNILYYEFRKENHATLGALYYCLGPILSLFAPAAAGFIAASFGFPTLYSAALVVFMLTFILTIFFVENGEYKYDFITSLRSISGLRSLIFMEGFAAAVITSVSLPVMLLLYLDRPLEFGIFTSLVTLFSVIAAFLTAKISDKIRKRRTFLLPVTAAFGLAAIFASQAPDIAFFFVGFGLVNFFGRIFFPLPLALAVDNTRSLADTMLGREYMLNLGRLLGTVFGFFVIMVSDIRTALLLQGLALLLYIPVFEYKKKKLARH